MGKELEKTINTHGRLTYLETLLPEIRKDIYELRREDLAELRKMMIERLDDQERRISELERWRAALVGMGAVIGAIAGSLISWLTRLLSNWVNGS